MVDEADEPQQQADEQEGRAPPGRVRVRVRVRAEVRAKFRARARARVREAALRQVRRSARAGCGLSRRWMAAGRQ